jgi:hypothetical protein
MQSNFENLSQPVVIKIDKNKTVNSISPQKLVGAAYPFMRAHFRAIEDPDSFNAFSTALKYLIDKTMYLSAVRNIKALTKH